ncbi:unnamed protein product, partial [Ectocarpus sp. 12 AP-2014]
NGDCCPLHRGCDAPVVVGAIARRDPLPPNEAEQGKLICSEKRDALAFSWASFLFLWVGTSVFLPSLPRPVLSDSPRKKVTTRNGKSARQRSAQRTRYDAMAVFVQTRTDQQTPVSCRRCPNTWCLLLLLLLLLLRPRKKLSIIFWTEKWKTTPPLPRRSFLFRLPSRRAHRSKNGNRFLLLLRRHRAVVRC